MNTTLTGTPGFEEKIEKLDELIETNDTSSIPLDDDPTNQLTHDTSTRGESEVIQHIDSSGYFFDKESVDEASELMEDEEDTEQEKRNLILQMVDEELDYVLAQQPNLVRDDKKALCINKADLDLFPLSEFKLVNRTGHDGCESNTNLTQIIPYIAVYDSNNMDILTYTRGKSIVEKRLASTDILKTFSLGFGGHIDFDFSSHITFILDDEGNPIKDEPNNIRNFLRTHIFIALGGLYELNEELGVEVSKENLKYIADGYINNPFLIPPTAQGSDVDKVHMGAVAFLPIDPEVVRIESKEPTKITHLQFLPAKNINFQMSLQIMLRDNALKGKFEAWSVNVFNRMTTSS